MCCGPVVRLLQRSMLPEVGNDGENGCGFLDADDDPYRAAAVDAGVDIDAKHPLEALRPRHRSATLLGCALVSDRIAIRRLRTGGVPLATPRRCQLRAQIRVRGEHPVGAGQVGARWRHQRRKLCDEVHRIPFHMRGPISPRRLELVAHPSLRRYRQPLLADRRACDVADLRGYNSRFSASAASRDGVADTDSTARCSLGDSPECLNEFRRVSS